MTPCHYVIKNLKGGDDIIIPAFNILSTEDLKDVLSNYDSKNVNAHSVLKEDFEKLEKFLKEHIHHKTVESILGDQTIFNLNELIEKVNDAIFREVSPENLWKSVVSYLNTDYRKKRNNIKNLINKLNVKDSDIEIKLLTNLNLELQSMASRSLNEEVREINDLIDSSEIMGNPTTYLTLLKSFVKLTNDFLGWKNANTIVKISGDRFKEGNWNLENSLVYSDTPDKSQLFMGLIKRLGSNLSQEKLNTILSLWNETLSGDKYSAYRVPENITPREFFLGSLGEDTTLPLFDKILSLISNPTKKVSTLLENTLDEIFLEISEMMAKEKGYTQETMAKYRKDINEIFVRIYPDYASSNDITELIESEKLNIEQTKQANHELLKESVNSLKELLSKMVAGGNSLGELYAPVISINGDVKGNIITDNPYNYLMSNAVIWKDLVRMPGKDQKDSKWPYWVITSIQPRLSKNNRNRVKVYGARLNNFNVYEVTSHEFDQDELISLRKYSPHSDTVYEKDAVVNQNAYLMTLETKITSKLAQSLISPGDLLGNRRVLEVYPGHIIVYNPTTDSEEKQYFSTFPEALKEGRSHQLVSKKLWNIINNPDIAYKGEFFIPSKKGKFMASFDKDTINNLSEGDYFKLKEWAGYKRILYADNESVWTFLDIKDQKGNPTKIIKQYSKTSISAGIVAPFEDSSDYKDILETAEEYSKNFSSSSRLSSFSDKVIAKPGDTLVYEKDDVILYGKIINKADEIAVMWDPKNQKWEKRSYSDLNVRFYSKDARLSATSLFNLKANLLNVEVRNIKETKDKNLVRMIYVVEGGVDPNVVAEKMSELIPGTLYTKIGRYIDIKYKQDSQIDLTNEILNLIGADPSSDGIFVNSVNNEYHRNYESASLRRLRGLEYLSPDYIRNNLLLKGVYFSMYNDSKLYSIERVAGDILYARVYNRTHEGDLILNEIQVNINELLNNSKDANNKHLPKTLSKIFMQHGNNAMVEAWKEIEKIRNKEQSSEEILKKDRIKLKTKLNSFFKALNVEVEETNDTSVFTDGQHAKFVTEANGTSKIILKEDLGKREDLVHETMHIYLAALRIASPENYIALLNSDPETSKLENESILVKEETFLRNMVKNLNELSNSFFSTKIDINGFLKGMQTAKILINPELLPENINASIVDILNQPIVEFLGLKSADSSHPLYNTNLAQSTPAFLVWLDQSNINFKCT